MRGLADAALIRRFMRELYERAHVEGRVYFTGGATAVLLGWRSSTIDIDVKFDPEHDALFRALPGIKEDLEINVELAAPSDFVPPLPGWESRSQFIGNEGRLQFLHYDVYSQALSKIERGHARDRADVADMLRSGLVDPVKLRDLFAAVEPQLVRYPAIDPATLRRSLHEALGEPGI